MKALAVTFSHPRRFLSWSHRVVPSYDGPIVWWSQLFSTKFQNEKLLLTKSHVHDVILQMSFLVKDPASDTLKITVVDEKTSDSIGTMRQELQNTKIDRFVEMAPLSCVPKPDKMYCNIFRKLPVTT